MNLSGKKPDYIYVDGKVSWFQWAWLGAFVGMSLVVFFKMEQFDQINWFGVIGCLLISVSTFLFRSGIQLDEKEKRIRYYIWIAGISWGKWYPLENFKCIVVSHVHTRTKKRGEESSSFKIFLSSVDIYKQQSMVLGELFDWESAINRANELGRLLKFEVKIKKPV